MAANGPRSKNRFRMWPIALVGLTSLASTWAAHGQDRPAGAGANPVAGEGAGSPRRYFVEASNCKRCHSHPEDYKKEADRLLCRMNEFPFWDEKDKHKIAYKILQEDRAKQMGEILGIAVTEAAACTNCHGTAGAAEAGQRFDVVENGVSCVACHGAYQDWVLRHQLPDDPSWRVNTREQKEKQFGMTDLWDPVTRATKCASCHIGSPKEMKVVTHAMYAAGHPPLPGLETATFSDAQPRHWQYLREKNEAARKDLKFNPAKREQTELVAVSGIVALRETMRLFAEQARQDGLVKQPETHWPDFARFDCYACHHDLQVPSWRQARGYLGAPGRPTTPAWPDVLVQLGIAIADPDGSKNRAAQFQQGVSAFRDATGGRPFGDRGRSASAAQALADWADGVCKDLHGLTEDPKQVVVDGTRALGLMRQLGKMAAEGPLDYDSARQIALAFRTIYLETREVDPSVRFDPEINKLLADLDGQFLLHLPAAGIQQPIVKTLGDRLKAVTDFGPEEFRSQFARIVACVPQGP
jgi:hypothetical protein